MEMRSLSDVDGDPGVLATEFDAPTQLFVLGTVVVAGLGISFNGVPLAVAMVGVSLPMWWRAIVRVPLAMVVLGLSGASLVAGWYLAELAADHHAVSQSVQLASIFILVGGLATMISVLWARAYFPLHVIALAYGCAVLADAMLNSSRSWKYHLAFPVAIIVIGWLGKYRNRLPAVVALIGIGFVTALDRGRSFFGFCTLAAAITLWQGRPRVAGRRTPSWYPIALLTGLGFVTYELAIRLLTQGYLGVAAQQRTIAQIESSGSLITGGRPEWMATKALASEQPWGYGLGVVPDARDYAVAKSGFDAIGAEPGGYLTNYMLGGRFRLHSITADLWVSYGVVGVLLALSIAFALVYSLGRSLATRECPPLVILAVIMATWHLAFGPIYSNWPDVCFALGIALLPQTHRSAPHEVTTHEMSSGF